MTRYVLIDTKTGEIAGDSTNLQVGVGATPQEVAAAIDAGNDAPARSYSMLGTRQPDSRPGYDVFKTDDFSIGEVDAAGAREKLEYAGFMEITEAPAA